MSDEITQLIKQGAVIVDVRTTAEFRMGANPKSINIPLDELSAKADNLQRDNVILLCCASGARSGMAAGILKRLGFQKVANAGPWENTVI